MQALSRTPPAEDFHFSHLLYFGPEATVYKGSEIESFSVSREGFPRSVVPETANDGFL